MNIKKTRYIVLAVILTLLLLWGSLRMYYKLSLELSGGSTPESFPENSNVLIAKYLQSDMEKYRDIHGTYPKISEQCQDIRVLKQYFGESVHGDYKYQYNYQSFLDFLYPEGNILLHPQELWRFFVSVSNDGSSYVFRVEDQNDNLTGIMHFVARYVVKADFSNKDVLSSTNSPHLSGTILGCDCTNLNYCVGSNNILSPK